MADRTKVLIVAHGHPDLSKGGGEIAAHNLHTGLSEQDDIASVFLARHDRDELLHGGTPFAGTGRPNEILFHSHMPDWFRFSQPDKARVWRDFREALESCRPDVVHFHHYLHLGLEMIREVRNFDPAVKIVLTLHEYFAICHHEGQMVTRPAREPCHESSPSACARCFPEHGPQDFMLRRQFIRSHFDLVDRFVSPSRFLRDRYVAWGLDPDRIEVIENVLSPATRRDARTERSVRADTASGRSSGHGSDRNPGRESSPAPGAQATRRPAPRPSPDAAADAATGPVRFAFFGQINAFKGIEVLLDAFDRLAPDVRERVRLDINGTGLDRQPKALRRRVAERLDALGDAARMRGAYRPEELGALMRASDWMIVPSTWWENSPMVILEARRHALPVICSDLGGMAEKIEHDRTGLHFLAGRADALAERITEVVNRPDERARFAEAMGASWEPDADLELHMALYADLLGRKDTRQDDEPTTPRLHAI